MRVPKTVSDTRQEFDRRGKAKTPQKCELVNTDGLGRIDWLDVVRILTIFFIVGFHWLRTFEASNDSGFTWSLGYERPGTGWSQLHYIVPDQTGFSVSCLINNLLSVPLEYGWEGVNVFVLLSGLGLSLTYSPHRPDFSLRRWYLRRFRRIMLPYLAISIPLIVFAEVFRFFGNSHRGLLGNMAMKLGKNLSDPIGMEILKNAFLIDPRARFWTTSFFSPAWWFIPPLLVAYLCFPLFHWAVTNLNTWIILPCSFAVTIVFYRLTGLGILPEHGWYFIVGHELCTFIIGILVGRLMVTEVGRSKVRDALSSRTLLLVGFVVLFLGNMANWFDQFVAFSSPVFALGMFLVLCAVGIRLSRWQAPREFSRKVDGYYVYLLHQFIAFPLVALMVSMFGVRTRALGYSCGLLSYLVVTTGIVLFFEKLWEAPRAGGQKRRFSDPKSKS